MRPHQVVIVLALFAAASASAQVAKPASYLDAGIPAVTREWRGADYARTVQILSAGSIPLPLFSDPQGAALLHRLTATENFSFYRNRSLPIQVRLEDYFAFHQNVNSLVKLYYANLVRGAYSSTAEIASLLAYLLRISAIGLDLTDEFLPTIPNDDRYAARMEGLRTMKSGLTTMFVGAEVTLTENNGFSPHDRSTLLEAMAATLPTIKKVFTSDYRVELRRKLEADRSKFSGAEDVRRIDTMVRELNS